MFLRAFIMKTLLEKINISTVYVGVVGLGYISRLYKVVFCTRFFRNFQPVGFDLTKNV